MLRVVLGLALLAVAAGIGFFFGRHLHPVPTASNEFQEPSTRSRTAEPALNAAPQVAAPQTSLPTPPPLEGSEPANARSHTTEASSDELTARGIGLPIAGLSPAAIQDTFNQARDNGQRRHEATDILAIRGTPVLAVDNGIVRKLFNSKAGGLTVYQYDAHEKYCYYYAHLDRYAEGLKEGQLVKRGDIIGYVGTTGNADPNTPHLHFAILQLGPEKQWWAGTQPINPFPVLMAAVTQTRAGTR